MENPNPEWYPAVDMNDQEKLGLNGKEILECITDNWQPRLQAVIKKLQENPNSLEAISSLCYIGREMLVVGQDSFEELERLSK